MRHQKSQHDKKEALYQQQIQLLEEEMKEIKERQRGVERINEKLMGVL